MLFYTDIMFEIYVNLFERLFAICFEMSEIFCFTRRPGPLPGSPGGPRGGSDRTSPLGPPTPSLQGSSRAPQHPPPPGVPEHPRDSRGVAGGLPGPSKEFHGSPRGG